MKPKGAHLIGEYLEEMSRLFGLNFRDFVFILISGTAALWDKILKNN